MLVWKEFNGFFIITNRSQWISRLFYGGQGKLSPRTSR